MCVMDHLFPLYLLFRKSLGSTIVDLKNANIFGGSMGSLGFSSAMMGGGPQF